jgi:hypothetical protein
MWCSYGVIHLPKDVRTGLLTPGLAYFPSIFTISGLSRGLNRQKLSEATPLDPAELLQPDEYCVKFAVLDGFM